MYRKHNPVNKEIALVCQKRSIFRSPHFFFTYLTTNLIQNINQSYLLHRHPASFFLGIFVHLEAGDVCQVRLSKSWIKNDIICLVQDRVIWAGFWNGVPSLSYADFNQENWESPWKAADHSMGSSFGYIKHQPTQASKWSMMVVIICSAICKLVRIST